jgi:hypothetical protein
MSTFVAPNTSFALRTGSTRRSCCAGAVTGRSRESKKDAAKGFDNFRRFLQDGVKGHDDAVADPAKQFVRVPGVQRLVDKGREDIEGERKRASILRDILRKKVKKHDDAIAESGERMKRLPSMRTIVDKGMRDIQDVAAHTRPPAPLSEYSEIWTFPVSLVTYSTLVIAWAAELAGMSRAFDLLPTGVSGYECVHTALFQT